MKKSDYEKLPKEKEFRTLVEISQDIANGGKMPVGSFSPTSKEELKIREKRTKRICKELFEK